MLPVITISRQFGSGGHEVGEKLAKRLELPFYDKELIALAAKKSGFSEEVFSDVDEKATSSLLYSMVMGSYAFGTRVPGINEMPINDKLFIIQSDIIKKALSALWAWATAMKKRRPTLSPRKTNSGPTITTSIPTTVGTTCRITI